MKTNKQIFCEKEQMLAHGVSATVEALMEGLKVKNHSAYLPAKTLTETPFVQTPSAKFREYLHLQLFAVFRSHEYKKRERTQVL